MKTREQVAEEIKSLIIKDRKIIAAWEGGSAATGYLDEYSDLDLAIVCEDDHVEKVFKKLEKLIDEKYGIERKYRVPEPAWHGFSQCFYKVGNVPELYYLDIAVIKKSLPDKFTERDRHGDSVVWFEKEKMIDPTPTPEKKVIEKGKKYFRYIADSDFLMEIELKKAIARKNFTEAFPAYMRLISSNLGILLNLKYRPCKVDFGLRYAYRDFPNKEVKLIEESFKASSIEEIEAGSKKVMKRIEELKKELSKKWN
ncbi:MAG TPA: nucleotidyltransferase domain-containing protein [Clostridiales bacterium]|nr:nucleotidyltransferase domain-containing protein [Clostridiales bacterium]HQP69433.1 nucleotidyltransferase domain-containing protein [Clostridiales bacterium]